MRLVPLLALLAMPLCAQFRLYTCMATTKDWVVATRLKPRGVFFRSSAGQWTQAGHGHPIMTAVDYDRRNPSTLYLAAGNGMIEARNHAADWKILTSYDVTELRDVSVDPNAPGTIYFAHATGIAVTRDGGQTWQPAQSARKRRFTEAIRVDRTRSGHLVAGTEDGILSSLDDGKSWQRAGASGFQIMHIAQSPHDACVWLAVTQQGGAFISRDCAKTFENLGEVGIHRNLYDISFDPTEPRRIALAGWGPGVQVSEDGGRTWEARNAGFPRNDVWSVAFDPGHPGRLYASVHEEAVYVSDDAGRHWRKDGLEGTVAYRMLFVPEVSK